jgi:2-polyprenyl-6-methoxyphenol hydroxylase-like FAD-dependent oxidoreductase
MELLLRLSCRTRTRQRQREGIDVGPGERAHQRRDRSSLGIDRLDQPRERRRHHLHVGERLGTQLHARHRVRVDQRALPVEERERGPNALVMRQGVADHAEPGGAEPCAQREPDGLPAELRPQREVTRQRHACIRIRQQLRLELRLLPEGARVQAQAGGGLQHGLRQRRQHRGFGHHPGIGREASKATTLATPDTASQRAKRHPQRQEAGVNLEGMKVAVVGGAIGGASSALALARAGASVTLLEREAAARPVGAGIALAENGLAVLQALGLDVRATSSELSGVRIVDARGRTLFAPAGRVNMIRRSALYDLLADAIAREPNIEARFGDELLDLQDERLIARSGVLHADLVIGADGVHSRVRTAAGIPARVRKAGIAYARALGPYGLARNEEAWTRAGLFGSFTIPGGTYWYASLGTPAARRAVAQRDLDGLCAAWVRAYPASEPLLLALPSFDALLVNEVLQVECPRYVRGKVALLGDAAHAMAPNLGQGANSALVDALALSEELRRADTLSKALAAYDQRRRPRVEKVARAAARVGRLAELTHPVLRFARDRILMPLAASRSRENTRLTLQEDPLALARAFA